MAFPLPFQGMIWCLISNMHTSISCNPSVSLIVPMSLPERYAILVMYLFFQKIQNWNPQKKDDKLYLMSKQLAPNCRWSHQSTNIGWMFEYWICVTLVRLPILSVEGSRFNTVMLSMKSTIFKIRLEFLCKHTCSKLKFCRPHR